MHIAAVDVGNDIDVACYWLGFLLFLRCPQIAVTQVQSLAD